MTRLSLPGWMLLAMVAGIAFGLAAPAWALPLSFLPNIFLRLIRSIIAPVLFGVLVTAMASSGGKGLGRIGWKSIVYFEIVSTLALLTGWAVCTALQPGRGITLTAAPAAERPDVTLTGILTEMFPTSIFDSMARGDVLQITLFCLLFGLACSAVGERARPVVSFAESVLQIAFQYTRYIMIFAPPAVFASMAITAAQHRGHALASLAKFIGAAWFAQIAYSVVVQGGSLLLARMPLGVFAREVREPFLVAFATTSSAAAIPQALAALRRLCVPENVAGIVTPLSLSFNASGSTIHVAMCAFFVAQAAGMNLTPFQQLLMLATLKLTTKGIAGIPRANFVVLAGLFPAFNLPLEGLTVLLGLDALIDPVRTGVNVLGHCTAPPVIARYEFLRAE